MDEDPLLLRDESLEADLHLHQGDLNAASRARGSGSCLAKESHAHREVGMPHILCSPPLRLVSGIGATPLLRGCGGCNHKRLWPRAAVSQHVVGWLAQSAAQARADLHFPGGACYSVATASNLAIKSGVPRGAPGNLPSDRQGARP